MDKQKEVVALIGDLINSKEIPNRNQVQQTLKQALSDINQRYRDDLLSEFMITLGDEFQGLLRSTGDVLSIISDLEQALYPFGLRFGIGCGEISTDIHERCSEIDGPAFHRARLMIQTIKESSNRHNKVYSSILICSDTTPTVQDKLINSVFSLCTSLKEKWSDRQVEIMDAYLKHDKNQYKTAEALGITQSSVNKSLKSSNFYTYHHALSTVTQFLTQESEDVS